MGGMYSGKTTELIRRLRRYESIGKKILTLNSKIDIRCGDTEIQTHDKKTYHAVKLDHLSIDAIRSNLEEADVVAIDEANFFVALLVAVIVHDSDVDTHIFHLVLS